MSTWKTSKTIRPLSAALPMQLVGRLVRIKWVYREHSPGGEMPWRVFRVLDVAAKWVRLQGDDDPDRPDERQEHGKPWWVRVREIDEVEELDEAEDDA